MACCLPAAAPQQDQKSKDLEVSLRREWKTVSVVHKLLLLGASQSGKSTLFKQMFVIYGKGFTDEDKKRYKTIVWLNMVSAIEELAIQSPLLERGVENAGCAVQGEEAKVAANFIRELKYEYGTMNAELAHHIQVLWRDPGIQQTYEKRAIFQLDDSASYFLNDLARIGRLDYLPTTPDIIRARHKTKAIVEHEFVIDTNQFKLLDVGGQRSERKKWIHCFSNVTAIIFVAAISEYDQVLYEDEKVNRLTESLNLFGKICESKWFNKMPIILFLNKRDLFAEKLERTPLSALFPEYKGGANYEKACTFVQEEFFRRSTKRDIYTHFTCATDTANVRVVMNSVRDIIIGKSAKSAGLDIM